MESRQTLVRIEAKRSDLRKYLYVLWYFRLGYVWHVGYKSVHSHLIKQLMQI